MKIKGVDNSLDLALWVQRLSIGIERDVKRAADRWLEAMLKEFNGEPPTGMTRRQFQRLIKSIKEHSTDELAPALTVALEGMAKMTATAQAAMISAAALERAADGWRLAMQQPIAATGDLLEPFVRGLERSAVDKMTRQIQIAMVKNLTLDESVREMKSVVNNLKSRDIEVVISTATQHAFLKSREAVFKAGGVKKVRCIATLD
ncbi:MAG: hypothetical protein ACRCT2_10515, partial [Plesiomonas shigelloides]